jgi:ABC-type branched-subunit amino acid transport system substrate-binding protein
MKRMRFIILIAVFALVAAACSSDDSDSSDDTTTTAASTETTPPETTETTVAAPAATTTTAAESMEIATDIGVDLDAGTIEIGLVSDLTGPFAPLVTLIVAGQEAYWANVNANGGINGLMVNLDAKDTAYDVAQTVQVYDEFKGQVAAIGHSTGSPQTLAYNEQLQEDGILAIPLTWYSGWTDPAINSNLMHHGIPYCLEAMNGIEWMVSETGGKTIALASVPGDFGLDSMAGAKIAAEALGLEIVSDGSGTIIPGQDQKPVADAIVQSGADMVYVTASPTPFSEVYGQAIAQGFVAAWSGAGPTYNPAFLGSPLAEPLERDWYGTFYLEGWNGESEGSAQMRDIIRAANADAPATDYYAEGFVEAKIMHDALLKAYDNGDMTQAGILAAAKSLENVEFNGMAPSEKFTGSANDQVQRSNMLFRVSREDIAAGGSGTVIVDANYTGETAKAYEFTSACFEL